MSWETATGSAHLQPSLKECAQARDNRLLGWRAWLATALALFAAIGAPMAPSALAARDELRGLDGQWLYIEDRTEGRASEEQSPPMSARFALRVEKDAVIHARPGGDERITLDGSVIEEASNNGSITLRRGVWKDGALEYTQETLRLPDKARVLLIRREFRLATDGLQVSVTVNDGHSSVALYRHPQDIALPAPAKAAIADAAWLAGAWVGTQGARSIEERWGPPLGGAMLGVSRTVSRGKMAAFEYLRIVERDGGLVYVAQPGGNPPTEFVLIELDEKRAVFANPRHDFPQRIVYELSKEGALTASIGFAKGGRPRSFEFKREGG